MPAWLQRRDLTESTGRVEASVNGLRSSRPGQRVLVSRVCRLPTGPVNRCAYFPRMTVDEHTENPTNELHYRGVNTVETCALSPAPRNQGEHEKNTNPTRSAEALQFFSLRVPRWWYPFDRLIALRVCIQPAPAKHQCAFFKRHASAAHPVQ